MKIRFAVKSSCNLFANFGADQWEECITRSSQHWQEVSLDSSCLKSTPGAHVAQAGASVPGKEGRGCIKKGI